MAGTDVGEVRPVIALLEVRPGADLHFVLFFVSRRGRPAVSRERPGPRPDELSPLYPLSARAARAAHPVSSWHRLLRDESQVRMAPRGPLWKQKLKPGPIRARDGVAKDSSRCGRESLWPCHTDSLRSIKKESLAWPDYLLRAKDTLRTSIGLCVTECVWLN